jgi:hypothetical protein
MIPVRTVGVISAFMNGKGGETELLRRTQAHAVPGEWGLVGAFGALRGYAKVWGWDWRKTSFGRESDTSKYPPGHPAPMEG